MKQIVCLATSPWYPIPTRKQQVMSRIPDAQILYFDPSVTYLAPLRDREAKKKLKAYRAPALTPQENIHVYSLPPVLPFFYRFRWINRWNQKKIARFIRKKMQQHGIYDPVLWVYSPVCCDLVREVPHSALVYDCVDRHSAYGGQMDPALVDRMELELAGAADQVFATAQSLCERLQTANPGSVFIPNGANYERFAQAAQPQPVPREMAALQGPVFGFVGALQQCISYELVLAAAQARPDWNFVFIGGKKPGVDLTALEQQDNIHFLGLKPNEALPQYLAHFDVCLNLFAPSDLSKDVSPLKFYEYLATGKPIVSTPQPEQVLQYAPLIHIAGDCDAFLAACQAALDDTAPDRRDARMAAGRASSWDARVAQMCKTLEEHGIF